MGPSELRKMCQLEDENGKPKRLVAGLNLDKAMIRDAAHSSVTQCRYHFCRIELPGAFTPHA